MGHLGEQAHRRRNQVLMRQDCTALIGVAMALVLHTMALLADAENFVPIKNRSILFKEHKIREAQQPTGKQQANGGFWFNKGHPNAHCFQAPEGLDCKSVLQNQASAEKALNNWKLDYRQLLSRITCTLQKLSCPLEGRSLQLHDIPCQSSCLEFLESCEKSRSLEGQYNNPVSAIPAGCPVEKRRVPLDAPSWSHSQKNQMYSSRASSPNAHRFPYGSTFYARRYSTYRNQPSSLSPRDVRPYPQTHQATPTFDSGYWKPRYQRRVSSFRSQEHSRGHESSDQLSFEQYTYPSRHEENKGDLELTRAACSLLPTGGCEKWPDYWGLQNQDSSPVQQKIQVNPGCPSDLSKMCEAMFPREFTRHHWIRGEYTVASVIRISQTLWWFGENDLFQPFFRFHVLETLESDIHPYDDKMILTYSWPIRCVCPDELTVNKRYLMLTHSYKARQTLNITANTVFLSRIKRYTKRLACWKGACVRSNRRNRRRRYPNSHWRWGST
ncbi:hypothetical protein T265_00643 [Opisthorchis viverrini]|uniref:Uncharacterized protein n=2 Tax=Opisthorchis viverrini TaxID=6198 RepID=A0A075A1C0_OPIVI|nr:hypothetical protein T265_00643 [Opisthorchis viverrini]KER33533.1 hypothetical protein T265_00643 [Opisthorchis viverrini]